MKRLMGLSLFLAASACGGGGGEDRVDAFIGTWAADTGGTTTLDCDNDELDDSGMLEGSTQIGMGTDTDLVFVDADATADCPAPKFNVSGSKATIVGNAMCTDMGDGITVTASYSKFDMTLDSAGTKLSIAANGTLNVTGAITATCTLTIAGTASKSAARENTDNKLFKPVQLVGRQ